MNLEPCRGCGRHVLVGKIANLVVKCDPAPLDGQGVARELAAGRQIWTPEFGPGLIPRRLRAARPGDPKLLREHRCPKSSRGPLTAPQGQGGERVPPKAPSPPVAPSRRPSGRRTGSSTRGSAPDAAIPASRTAPCDTCGRPVVLDGPELYTAVELGASIVWAVHETCS